MRYRFPPRRQWGVRWRWPRHLHHLRHLRPRQCLRQGRESSSWGCRKGRRIACPKARRGERLPVGPRGRRRLRHPWRCPRRGLLQRDLHRRRPRRRIRPYREGPRPWCREGPCRCRVVRPRCMGCRTRPPWGDLRRGYRRRMRRRRRQRPARGTSTRCSRRLWTRTGGKPREAEEPRRQHRGVKLTFAS